MDQFFEKLNNYILANKIKAEHIKFNQTCHSVSDASKAVKAPIDSFVKNICFIDKNDNIITAIVKGEDRINVSKLQNVASIGRIRKATPDEVLALTGYPVGGVPSFGYKATFFIDKKVLEKEIVYSGGGSENALVKITPFEMQKANLGQLVDII